VYPNLFSQCSFEHLVCDACELAKHTRNTSVSHDNKSSVPFMTIHSDVWGPSSVVSLSGYRWFVTFIDDCP